MKKISLLVILLFVVIGGWYIFRDSSSGNDLVQKPIATDPINAVYSVGGVSVQLEGGVHEEILDSDMSTKTTTRVFGEPVYGDLDKDGDDDAVLFLTNDSGGSGTFYYAVAALNKDGVYEGSSAIFIGDRIAPQNIGIRNGIAMINFADRNPGEPFATSPSVGKTLYAKFTNGDFVQAVDNFEEGEEFLQGYIYYGHEVREFVPCGEGVPQYWILGDSPVIENIKSIYTREMPEVSPILAPLFVSIVGEIADSPEDGFGADYDYAIRISKIVDVWREGNCKSDLITITSPKAGSKITSPLTVEGRARGTWYFEGDFPLILVDWDGKIIAETFVTAKSDWMTEDFVLFEGKVEFIAPESGGGIPNRGTLIFKKDNPSDLPEHSDALEIPVTF